MKVWKSMVAWCELNRYLEADKNFLSKSLMTRRSNLGLGCPVPWSWTSSIHSSNTWFDSRRRTMASGSPCSCVYQVPLFHANMSTQEALTVNARVYEGIPGKITAQRFDKRHVLNKRKPRNHREWRGVLHIFLLFSVNDTNGYKWQYSLSAALSRMSCLLVDVRDMCR